MQEFYEKLMNRMSTALKPVSSAYGAKPKQVRRDTLGFRPYITVSREPGSGGRPIAKKVAKMTGFTHYDKKLIERVSKSARKRKALIESVDEKSRTGMQDLVHSFFDSEYVSDISYIKHLSNVVLTLSEKGDVVILGRGGNFVTSRRRGLHVRVSAPYMVRVMRAMKHEKIDEKKARKVIKKVDDDRRSFVSQYFGKSISNSDYYDMIINTTYMTIDEAAELIVRMFELKFPRYLRRFKIRKGRRRR